MNSYMFVFWAPEQVLAKPRSRQQAIESGAMWDSWQKTLRNAGHSVSGAQLEAGGQCVVGPEKTVSAGPFGHGHVMGGYFVVSASSLEQATDLAKGCPLLQGGGTVEVRPLMHEE